MELYEYQCSDYYQVTHVPAERRCTRYLYLISNNCLRAETSSLDELKRKIILVLPASPRNEL